MHNGGIWQLHSKLLPNTPIINIFTNSVHGHYTIGATTLKEKFSVVAIDHFSNWVEVKEVMGHDATTTANFWKERYWEEGLCPKRCLLIMEPNSKVNSNYCVNEMASSMIIQVYIGLKGMGLQSGSFNH